MRPRTKRVLLFLASLPLLVLLAVGLAFAVWWFDSPFDASDFDRDTWLAMAGNMDPDNPRGGMAADLIERLEERSMSRAAVLELLGPTEYPCSELHPPRGPIDTCLSYNLGMWSGLRWDYDTLDVYFDSTYRVATAITVQH